MTMDQTSQFCTFYLNKLPSASNFALCRKFFGTSR